MTMQDDLIYKARQLLQNSERDIPADMAEKLRQARFRAIHRAEEVYPKTRRHSIRFFSEQRWGLGLGFASLAAVFISLSIAHQAGVEDDIRRVAEIDQRMITDRLPVQAYLDPGFLAFQEETLPEGNVSVAAIVNGPTVSVRSVWSPQTMFPGVTPSSGPSWSKLTATQREALAPLESFWGDFDINRKNKWIKIADRFHQLSPEQQSLAQNRMQDWASLQTSERRVARAVYGNVVETIPENVRAMKWNEYQKLSEAERARLIELAQQKVADATPGKMTSPTNKNGGALITPRPQSALASQAAKPLVP